MKISDTCVDQTFYKQDLEDIFTGALLFGSGGGGGIHISQSILTTLLKITDHVEYIAPSALNPTEWGVVIAGMGSPQAAKDSTFREAPLRSLQLFEEAKQKGFPNESADPTYRFSYLVPVETGAVAHMITLLVAAQKGLLVVDGDGGGRAFPSLAMSTFASNAVPVAPATLVTERAVEKGGTEVLLNSNDPAAVDDMSRALLSTSEFNDLASLTAFSMTGAKIPQVIVPHTLTRARDVGRLIRENPQDPVQAVLSFLNGYELFAGEIISIKETTTGGFDFGTVTIQNAQSGEIVYVLNQNESIIAWSDQKSSPLAMAPDLICYMTDDGQPLSTADLQEHQRVTLIGLRAAKQLRVPYFINIFAKVYQNFGYHGPYVPIENLR